MNTGNSPPCNRCAAFTRVELLIVLLVLLCVLLHISPAFHEWDQRTKAKMIVDASNLKQIGISLRAYSRDNEGKHPDHPKAVIPYLPGPAAEVFFSPFQELREELGTGYREGLLFRYGSYIFIDLDISLGDIENPGDKVIAYTAIISSKQTKRNVLFADGHTEQWDEAQLLAALPEGVDVDALDGP